MNGISCRSAQPSKEANAQFTRILDQPFTLRQLLRHEAGLADYGELVDYHTAVSNGEPAWSADEMMQRLDGTRLRYSPGAG